MRLIDADALTTEVGKLKDYLCTIDLLGDVMGRIEDFPTAMQWAGVEEKLPPLGSSVLARFCNGSMNVVQLACFSKQFVGGGDVVCQKCFTVHAKNPENYVTHWMPLPEPPE